LPTAAAFAVATTNSVAGQFAPITSCSGSLGRGGAPRRVAPSARARNRRGWRAPERGPAGAGRRTVHDCRTWGNDCTRV
jgi:hypothetical protein